MKKVFRAMQLRTHSYAAFRKHAYLEPAIIHSWTEWQTPMLQTLSKATTVILGGDMRADSPGHSAKYGSYTMMDVQTNKIVDIQLVQSNEVGGSSYMEKEGLIRALDLLHGSGVKLDCIITDRHPPIPKFLRDRKITHYYDVWHVAKDVHSHSDPAFPKCGHQPNASKDPSKWFRPGSTALNSIEKVLTNKRCLTDVEKLSHHFQTSTVESFQCHPVFCSQKRCFPLHWNAMRVVPCCHALHRECRARTTEDSQGETNVYTCVPKGQKGRLHSQTNEDRANNVHTQQAMSST
ncbi:uncharacterized protein LOC124488067 isoform X2 [Hypomesus transpacificus]|uniref:uncharacterized protein LOC124488067 isoform X2 n=1 Tax=Hypomesus transpacificus TaxID=137520 RepID=UPI001F083A53|nr:uncharacterized protein LOC124488067 isoform X2 [Hypomesus transpacificus]